METRWMGSNGSKKLNYRPPYRSPGRGEKSMEKKGFSPNGIKKLLAGDRFRNCAYVHTDGVVFIEERTCKSGKQEFSKTFNHIMAANIPIYITNHRYSMTNERFIGRLVLHNPTLLIDGIKQVEIYYNNKSESMVQKGLTCDSVTITTNSGMKIHQNIFTFISSDIVIQNEDKKSIMNFDGYDAIWHTEKPVVEEVEQAA